MRIEQPDSTLSLCIYVRFALCCLSLFCFTMSAYGNLQCSRCSPSRLCLNTPCWCMGLWRGCKGLWRYCIGVVVGVQGLVVGLQLLFLTMYAGCTCRSRHVRRACAQSSAVAQLREMHNSIRRTLIHCSATHITNTPKGVCSALVCNRYLALTRPVVHAEYAAPDAAHRQLRQLYL